ncbi:hypothetical protein [Caulobacter sp. Root655]|uniref:hypothetical protein n=1 Tax=Caulobacter sp. Root655 TaxID=1736578 RepID=UPI000A4265F6|nr:hypothetical protein [Caulobacter sp. Root655]
MKPKEELSNLLNFFNALESKRIFLSHNKVDVTDIEFEKLKPDIAYIKSVIARENP